ncbi:hypothetical protein THII_2526 [Thioploca ingrica]|uniref:DUF2281 domain-containing protein n=1 Tax=Thioploca ingrica TaxID=40754 RepID=A0A090AFF7_9GAMM|nr:hypothetical protein THII_2526 [Thioploca ingrica]
MTLEQQLLQQFKMLPLAKQAEILDFAQFLVERQQMDKEVAKPTTPNRLGLLKEKLKVVDDFDAPLPDEILKTFYASLS